MKIYLHVGMNKTGTSTIQNAFYRAAEDLIDYGLCYPRLEINHSKFIFSAFCDSPEKYHINVRADRHTADAIAEYNASSLQRLRSEILESGCSKIVISAEDASKLSPAGVLRMKEYFDGICTNYRIIFYYRDFYQFVSSSSQQHIRGGFTFSDLERKPPRPNYRGRIEKFLNVFGPEVFDLRRFSIDAFDDGNLLADFCAAVETPEAKESLPQLESNISFSAPAVALLNAYNEATPRFVEINGKAANNPDRSGDSFVQRVLSGIPGPKFAAPVAVMDRVASECSADIAWMSELVGRDVRGSRDSGADDWGNYANAHELVPSLQVLGRMEHHSPTAVLAACRRLLALHPGNPQLRAFYNRYLRENAASC